MDKKPTKFYNLSREARLNILFDEHCISTEAKELYLQQKNLDNAIANSLIENQISQFPLPVGVIRDFKLDNQTYTIPMVVEEPSVVAACNHSAKTFSQFGFSSHMSKSLMIGQIILTDVPDYSAAAVLINSNLSTIKGLAEKSHPSIVKRGGGLKTITCQNWMQEDNKDFFTINCAIDVKDAMGANIVNTILEGISPYITKITGGQRLMAILSNYNTESLVTATCKVPITDIPNRSNLSQKELANRIVAASEYAKIDPYRAATHNKGIMNGIDSVVIATGNDPRAVEAGVHAYAARNGRYEGLSSWSISDQIYLVGEMTLPLSIGTVGGAISVLPLAKANLEMMNNPSSEELAAIICAVGLSQNFAALKALVSEGIQKGHMSLHAKSLAIQIGAKNDEIERVAQRLQMLKKMNSETAIKILNDIRKIK
ncbi:hydroxymethylglutaryl-CoA reductase, degradative [Vagococcus vulneris]|uniref:3-hydroxy-3-methylglutaryl coenzyme A reductase n=1 Tax=Vagococcus vulneris TaxID=1977869 RepID=A0A429ZXT8_9ENTE|nr:hydroxymethylglutaryl-CoA reductase, degradative [Vagococcus vulneris]RST98713.1 hydroxymethylglutaryl-CoA reductase, degradative [Vagococcus vulneris]